MTLPNYFLKQLANSRRGYRHESFPKDYVDAANLCPRCGLVVLWKKIMGARQIDGLWDRGFEKYMHYKCHWEHQDEVAEGSRKFRRSGLVEAVSKGNLDEAEYRYWIGVEQQAYWFALCRCCRKSFYGGADTRQRHLQDEAMAVGGERCAGRLTLAYKAMSSIEFCLVCKRNRYGVGGKWGIPLCNDIKCLRTWKFDINQKYVALEAELRRQERVAHDELEAKIIASKAVTSLVGLVVKAKASDGQMKEYCTLCKLFIDNVAHEEIHKAYMRSSYHTGNA